MRVILASHYPIHITKKPPTKNSWWHSNSINMIDDDDRNKLSGHTHTHTQAQTNVPLPDNLPPPEYELHVIRK